MPSSANGGAFLLITGEWTTGTNILGLVFFAIILGITLAKMGEKGKPLLAFFTCLSEAMMQITTWVINLAPVGVFFLIGGQVALSPELGTCGIFVKKGFFQYKKNRKCPALKTVFFGQRLLKQPASVKK